MISIQGFLNPSSQPSRQAQQRAPSNYGLMDQLAALHWLQENIHAFGGDPRQVSDLRELQLKYSYEQFTINIIISGYVNGPWHRSCLRTFLND